MGWPWTGPGSGAELDSSSVPCASSSSHSRVCMGSGVQRPQGGNTAPGDGCASHCVRCLHTLGSSSRQESPNILWLS